MALAMRRSGVRLLEAAPRNCRWTPCGAIMSDSDKVLSPSDPNVRGNWPTGSDCHEGAVKIEREAD